MIRSKNPIFIFFQWFRYTNLDGQFDKKNIGGMKLLTAT